MRSRAFSWNVGLLLASGALWTLIAGTVPTWTARILGTEPLTGIRAAMLVGAAGTATAAGAFAFVHTASSTRHGDAQAKHRDRNAGEALRSLFLPPRVRLLVALVFLWMVASALVLPFFNLYFLRVHGLPVERIGFLFATVQALTALVVFGGGELAHRLGPTRAFAAWTALFPTALVALVLVQPLMWAVPLYALQGFVPPATNPLLDEALLAETPRPMHGAVSAWRNGATELSGFVGAYGGGRLLEATSFGVLFAVAAGVAVLGGGGLSLALRRSRS
jgi:predicted MFS family arabinose efflux permease